MNYNNNIALPMDVFLRASKTITAWCTTGHRKVNLVPVLNTSRIPLFLATVFSLIFSINSALATALPAGERGYEMNPNVIRPDGIDGFFLEVDANGPVNGVTIVIGFPFIGPGQSDGLDLTPQSLRDDGLEGDRVAGDFIFTLGPIRYNTSWPFVLIENLYGYPDGLVFGDVGVNECLVVEESDGSTWRFLVCPELGLLRADVPLVPATALSPTVWATPHLLNVKTSGRGVQRMLRGGLITLDEATNAIYSLLPDSFDFLTFFSTDKIERISRSGSTNTGTHTNVKVDYTGTGLSPLDNTAFWGSAGKLLGINSLDLNRRGVTSNNVTHELLHQWAGNANGHVLGINGSGSHYNVRSNVGSLLGGALWQGNGDGSFSIECNPLQGRNGAFFASPLDKYFMGLIDGDQVPPIHVYDSSLPIPSLMCSSGPASFTNIPVTVTIADIQNLHGVRTPGPATAQRDFNIGFVAESHERLMTPVEMTFYEILAREYTAPISQGDATPYLGISGWDSIDRYFGEGTSWSSQIFTDADTDNDGLTDVDEVTTYGTNPVNPDTDGDSMPDGWETQYGLDPLADDSALDTDNDTVSNLDEYTAGTDPTIAPDGDLNGDGQVNAADVIIATRIVHGSLMLTPEYLTHGDVAPLVNDAPASNGIFNVGDLLLIMRKSLGVVSF